MKKSRFSYWMILGFLVLTTACTKVEGEGGSSTITGTIVANKKNSAGAIISTYPAENQDVYIIYGEGSKTHDDKVETSYDGSFKINYLEKGKYTLYTYEKCSSCPSGNQAVFKSVEISKAKEIVNVGTLYIVD